MSTCALYLPYFEDDKAEEKCTSRVSLQGTCTTDIVNELTSLNTSTL